MSYATQGFTSTLLSRKHLIGHHLCYWRKKTNQEAAIDAPEELDGYQLERSAAAGETELSTVTYSVVEMKQSRQLMSL
jgi:hypothetical protein